MSRANISPRKRQQVVARYGAAPDRSRVRGPATTTTSSALDSRDVEVLAARCPGCGYTYEVEAGDEHEGFAAGTAWADIPADWCCPDCGVRDKADFVPFEPRRGADV